MINLPKHTLQKISPKPPVLDGLMSGSPDLRINLEQRYSIVMGIDLLILNLSLLAVISIQRSIYLLSELQFDSLLFLFFLANVLWVFTTAFTEVYRIVDRVKLDLSMKDLFRATLIFYGVFALFYYQIFFTIFEVHILMPSFLSFLAMSGLSHIALRYYFKNKDGYLYYAVIGGKPSDLRYLQNSFQAVYGDKTVCAGRFGHEYISGINKLGDYRRIREYIQNHPEPFNKLLYFNSDMSTKQIMQIMQLCRSRFIDFEVVPREIRLFKKGVQIEQLPNLPIFSRKSEPLCWLPNMILKRSFDIIFSLAVIVLVFPWLFPLIALAIRLESSGPVFFVQSRSGYWNKAFKCIKFRTMKINQFSDKKQAVKGDPRITKVGAFLRKTNLDELPQFINVIKGDMSVVGPRPHMLKHTEDYSKLISTFMIRHAVKPGITGWAQVNGWRGPTEHLYKMAKRVEYDVNYIENWNIWFDCKCIYLTITNMILGEKNAI